MREMTADNATFLLHGVYLPALKNESQVTKRVIEAVPADKADYRPDAVSKTAMELVRHIAAADVRFADTTINGKFETGALLPAELKTPSRNRGMVREKLCGEIGRVVEIDERTV